MCDDPDVDVSDGQRTEIRTFLQQCGQCEMQPSVIKPGTFYEEDYPEEYGGQLYNEFGEVVDTEDEYLNGACADGRERERDRR